MGGVAIEVPRTQRLRGHWTSEARLLHMVSAMPIRTERDILNQTKLSTSSKQQQKPTNKQKNEQNIEYRGETTQRPLTKATLAFPLCKNMGNAVTGFMKP